MKSDKAKKYIEGVVVSDKMDKTIVVLVNSLKMHTKYLKRYAASKRYKAHDPENKYKTGDKVKIVPASPRSREKKWEVVNNSRIEND